MMLRTLVVHSPSGRKQFVELRKEKVVSARPSAAVESRKSMKAKNQGRIWPYRPVVRPMRAQRIVRPTKASAMASKMREGGWCA
jgi:hypothetical protein